MRLVLCDDNRLLSEALAATLEARGHQVLAITATPADGLTAVSRHRPDVILLELRFAGGADGLDAARAVRQYYPDTAVLVLSGLADRAVWSAATRIGVAGCLSKDQDAGQVAAALDVIAAGGVVLDPAVSQPAGAAPARRRCASPRNPLTPREQEILRRLVAGQSTGQMAAEMSISISTVRTYVKNVLAKLGTHSRLQAAALAARTEQPDEVYA